MRKAIFKLLLFVNYCLVALLLLSHVATEVSPNIMWLLPFFGIAYPFFLLGNIFFLMLWMLKRKWAVLLPLLFIGLNYSYVFNYFPVNFTESKEEKGVKLISYNVRMFDLYNWTRDRYTSSKAIHYILEEKPDIAFFQEYYSHNGKKKQPTERFRNELGLKHHVAQSNYWRGRDNGLATFSRYPIVKHQFLKMGKQPYALCTDVLVHNDTLRLVNVHLQSIHFGYEQYNFIDSIKFKNTEQKRDGVLKIFKKLKLAFQKRATQAETLRNFVSASPHKVVLAGDFNDTPSSYAYYQISRKLNDAFVDNCSGIGASYKRINFPFRIDFILTDPKLKANSFKLDDVDFSDHRPISCFVELP